MKDMWDNLKGIFLSLCVQNVAAYKHDNYDKCSNILSFKLYTSKECINFAQNKYFIRLLKLWISLFCSVVPESNLRWSSIQCKWDGEGEGQVAILVLQAT